MSHAARSLKAAGIVIAVGRVGLMFLSALVLMIFVAEPAVAGDGGDGEIDIVLLGDSFSAGNGAGNYWSAEDDCHRIARLEAGG